MLPATHLLSSVRSIFSYIFSNSDCSSTTHSPLAVSHT